VTTPSWLQKAEDQLSSHALLLHAVSALSTLVKSALVSKHTDAYEVLQSIERAIDTMIAGFDGKISRDEVEKHLRVLLDRAAAITGPDDQAVDAAIAAKFPAGGSDGQ
jgi:cell fate (sporulation/competence/biofilm development) regulator YmcA (YheA/YmcA/DUF963 family)